MLSISCAKNALQIIGGRFDFLTLDEANTILKSASGILSNILNKISKIWNAYLNGSDELEAAIAKCLLAVAITEAKDESNL